MTSAAVTTLPKTTGNISTFSTGETSSNHSEKLSLPSHKSSHGSFSRLAQSIYSSKFPDANQRLKRRHGASAFQKIFNQGQGHSYKPYRYLPAYISHIGTCRPKRVWFLCRFGLKTEIDFAHFGLESSIVFEETTKVYERIYRFNSK